MGFAGEVRSVLHTRKEYGCAWCDEQIAKNSSMSTWGWFDKGRGYTIRVHPECYEAMLEDAGHGYFEFDPCENRRGCNCGRDADCQRCRENKKLIEDGG